MSYTKGPWKLDQYGTLKGSNGDAVIEYGSGIAQAGLPTKEYKANARIRNAAPQLLEALKDLANMAASGNSSQYIDAVNQARAAIRAAEGEE